MRLVFLFCVNTHNYPNCLKLIKNLTFCNRKYRQKGHLFNMQAEMSRMDISSISIVSINFSKSMHNVNIP